MKITTMINADLHVKTGGMTTNFYTAIYDTPKGRERGKNYLSLKAAQEEAEVYCECFNYKLFYIDENLLFLR